MLKSLLRRALTAFGLVLALVSGPVAARASQPAQPALWEVSDADTTIYLFGTIHLLPHAYQWQTPAVGKAEASAQSLVIETIVDPAHPQPYLNAFLQLGFGHGLPPIETRVPAAKRPALLAAIAQSGVPKSQYDQMKTWAVGFNLLQIQFKKMGLEGKEGPETVLREAFTAANKPVEQLETNYDQLAFFDRLPESAQRQLLEGAIDPPEEARKEFNKMLFAWSAGDVNGIAKTFNEDLSGAPEMQRTIVRQRNANWSKWIEQRMTQPGAIMVAVGAGHLAGPDSVIALLKRDGYKVRRLQ